MTSMVTTMEEHGGKRGTDYSHKLRAKTTIIIKLEAPTSAQMRAEGAVTRAVAIGMEEKE